MSKKLLVLATVAVAFLLIVLAIAVHTARSDPSSSSGSGGSTAGDVRSAPEVDPSSEQKSAVGGTNGAVDATGRPASATTPITRAVISTGSISLRPGSMAQARAEVMRLVAAWGGTVAQEQTSADQRGRLVESTMTLRVPSPRFPDAMTALAGLGKVEHESRTSEDVTTAVIDNDARVRAAERSIRQIENLLSRAEKLSDIIAIESDLARRQADLDSLMSQQAYLRDQTTLSTVNVHLSRDGIGRPERKEARGFLAGLDEGWTAMRDATVALLTVVGALLPFALVLLLLGLPLWLVVRRRSAARVTGGSAPARSA